MHFHFVQDSSESILQNKPPHHYQDDISWLKKERVFVWIQVKWPHSAGIQDYPTCLRKTGLIKARVNIRLNDKRKCLQRTSLWCQPAGTTPSYKNYNCVGNGSYRCGLEMSPKKKKTTINCRLKLKNTHMHSKSVWSSSVWPQDFIVSQDFIIPHLQYKITALHNESQHSNS